MSIYNHVKNKSDLIDAIVDQIFSEITWDYEGTTWRDAMMVRALSTRETLRAHPWAIPLLESRTAPGPETLAHHDKVLACFKSSGFPLNLSGHAFSALDAYTYGFIMTEQNLPFENEQELQAVAKEITDSFPKEMFPALYDFIVNYTLQPGYSYSKEFMVGLEMILDQLEMKLKDHLTC